MYYDVRVCAIWITNKVECLDKEESYNNSTKEVILTYPCNAIKKCWTKFHFIYTLSLGFIRCETNSKATREGFIPSQC